MAERKAIGILECGVSKMEQFWVKFCVGWWEERLVKLLELREENVEVKFWLSDLD